MPLVTLTRVSMIGGTSEVDESTAAELVAGAAVLELIGPDKLDIIDEPCTDDDATRVVENGAGPSVATDEGLGIWPSGIWLTTFGILIAGAEELIAGTTVELAMTVELLVMTEELATICGELLGAMEELATAAGELGLTEAEAVEVGEDEELGAFELLAAAMVDDGNTTVLAMQALLTEFVGSFGEFRYATWIAPMTPEEGF